jgi:peptide methionine sulfoxide reductase MsrA
MSLTRHKTRLRDRHDVVGTYEEVGSARTDHTEAVLPAKTSYDALLKRFWENHDPTQGMCPIGPGVPAEG